MDLLINEHKLFCDKGKGILTEISEYLKSAETTSILLHIRLKRCHVQLQHVMSSLETVNVKIYSLCPPVYLQDSIDTHEDHLLLFEKFVVNLGMQLENEFRNLKFLKGKFENFNIPDCEYLCIPICDIEEPECEHPAVSDDEKGELLVEIPENCDISYCDNSASELLVEIPEYNCDCISNCDSNVTLSASCTCDTVLLKSALVTASNCDSETLNYDDFKLYPCEYDMCHVICKYWNFSMCDIESDTCCDVTVFQCLWKTLLCSNFPT